jgi:iron(III) transport system substrate-binding protein
MLRYTPRNISGGNVMRVTTLLAAATITLFTVTAAPAQTAKGWDDVIAAAKKEGEVIVYTAYLSPQTNEPIARAFEKKYGVKVTYLAARGSEIRERIRSEQNANRFIGDLLHHALSSVSTWAEADNNLQELKGVPNAARLKEPFRSAADKFQVPIFTINYGFLVNTRLVKPEDEPKKWADLLDPKWQGKAILDDPRAAGGGAVMFRMLHDKYGKEFLEKLAAQKPVLARDYAIMARRVAQGEFALYYPYILSDYSNIKGLPVKYIVPEDGVTYGSYSAAVMRNAPHPNAARLLADFYLSDEVQTIYAKEAHGIVVDGVKEKLAPETVALMNAKPLVKENFPAIDAMYALAKEIYK